MNMVKTKMMTGTKPMKMTGATVGRYGGKWEGGAR